MKRRRRRRKKKIKRRKKRTKRRKRRKKRRRSPKRKRQKVNQASRKMPRPSREENKTNCWTWHLKREKTNVHYTILLLQVFCVYILQSAKSLYQNVFLPKKCSTSSNKQNHQNIFSKWSKYSAVNWRYILCTNILITNLVHFLFLFWPPSNAKVKLNILPSASVLRYIVKTRDSHPFTKCPFLSIC